MLILLGEVACGSLLAPGCNNITYNKLFFFHFADIDHLPDPAVFDKLLDEVPSSPYPASIMSVVTKEEAKFPVCGDSVYNSPASSSPPHSPPISESGSNSSTDEGIQSDISDLEYIDG